VASRAFVLLSAAAAASVLAACGGGGSGSTGGVDRTLGYFPADSAAVVVVSTDLESDQFKALDRIVEERVHRHIESYLRDQVEQDGTFSWESELKPLLGRELVFGWLGVPFLGGSGSFLAAFHAQDGGKLRDVIESKDRFVRGDDVNDARTYRDKGTGQQLAVDGDVLLAASNESTLRDALARADDPGRLTEKRFRATLGDLPRDALVQAYGDATLLFNIPRFTVLRQLPWLDAIRNYGAAVSFAKGRAQLDYTLVTDPQGLGPNDLPLATGSDAPEVLRREGEIVGGNRNQSFTTAFLFRLAEIAFPNSRFVEDVQALERDFKIDFVKEVLRQFNGPSASAVSIDGKTFAARSAVRDPEALKALLPRLAPHLPKLVVGLQGLQSQGELFLFLLAPDILALQGSEITVTRAGDLWRVTGLTGEGPDQLYFGVLGDVFVVASDPGLAHRVATEPTVTVDGARGAGVLRVDLSGQRAEIAKQLSFDPGRIGEVVAWLEASTKRLRGQVSVELP
jgi:hypothetical protein